MKPANRNFLIFVLASALAAAAPGCGSSDDPVGEGQPVKPDTGDEICDNGIDDDGDELVDCEDPDCHVLKECTPDCSAQVGTDQVPGCEGDQKGSINRVCIAGTCEAVGQVSPTGSFLRGSTMVYSTLVAALEQQAAQNKGYLVEFFHSIRPDGSPATCDALVEAGRSGSAVVGFNVVGSESGSITSGNNTIPSLATGIAVPEEGASWFVLSRLYGSVDNGVAAGEIRGIGCTAGAVVLPGPWLDDDAHKLNVTIQPVCSPSDPDSCPGELTCLPGTLACRDMRCGTECSDSRVMICRDIDGSAECLQRCDPETISTSPCPDLHRCDTTPGAYPACVPLDAK